MTLIYNSNKELVKKINELCLINMIHYKIENIYKKRYSEILDFLDLVK